MYIFVFFNLVDLCFKVYGKEGIEKKRLCVYSSIICIFYIRNMLIFKMIN